MYASNVHERSKPQDQQSPVILQVLDAMLRSVDPVYAAQIEASASSSSSSSSSFSSSSSSFSSSSSSSSSSSMAESRDSGSSGGRPEFVLEGEHVRRYPDWVALPNAEPLVRFFLTFLRILISLLMHVSDYK